MIFTSDGPSDLFDRLIASAETPLVIWDFDGVVADTEPLHEKTYALLAARRNHALPSGFFAELVGHTEEWIWRRLITNGFPAMFDQEPDLRSERATEFAALAEIGLKPSWLSSSFMPQFEAAGFTQVIVSNGDPELIDSLMSRWRLRTFAEVARRGAGEDKGSVFLSHCRAGAIVFEDSDEYLDLGRAQGAVTVAVQHSHNTHARLVANFSAAL